MLIVSVLLVVKIAMINTGFSLGTLPVLRKSKGCLTFNEIEGLNEQVRRELFGIVRVPDCGEGFWKPVITLNMSNVQETCPIGWSTKVSNPRSCVQNNSPGCSLAALPAGTTYRRVCGRALGYAYNTNDAFANYNSTARRDFNYADGINLFINTSTPLHVWTFAIDQLHSGLPRCPCSYGTWWNYNVPDYVGPNYFCDTHSVNNNLVWDGRGCQAVACCDYNSPPWFKRSFNSTLSSDFLVRICTDEVSSNEFVSIIELEIYVQ